MAMQSPLSVPAAVLCHTHHCLCSVPQHAPGFPLLSVTHHQSCLQASASVQTLISRQSCLNPLRSLPAFLKHDKCTSGKATSSFLCHFLAENPCSDKKANLHGKALSSSLVMFCRTGETSPSAEKVKAIKPSGCRNDLLSGEVWTPVAGCNCSCYTAVSGWMKRTQSCRKNTPWFTFSHSQQQMSGEK